MESSDWVAVGRVGRPHGVRGGLHVHLENPDSELLRAGLPVRVVLPSGKAVALEVEEVYGAGLVRFVGVGDRDVADTYKNAELQVRREDFPPPDEDEAYLVDLIGARVLHKDGRELGVIEGFDAGGPQLLAQVRRAVEGDLVDVPFVPGLVVGVDEEAGVVTLDPPWGLLEGEPDEAG